MRPDKKRPVTEAESTRWTTARIGFSFATLDEESRIYHGDGTNQGGPYRISMLCKDSHVILSKSNLADFQYGVQCPWTREREREYHIYSFDDMS